MGHFSAYLNIYNDWDILHLSLKSIEDRIDELVVVDGAYAWMVPLLEGIGYDPARSKDQVYDIISSLNVKTTFISKVWNNELEKRQAGYAACSNRFVYRIDSDEVLFFSPGAVEKFMATGAAVGQMDMPTYLAPGVIEGANSPSRLPRQSLLFDRNQIESNAHLAYLWLVLGPDALPGDAHVTKPVFPDALAFNAHLTTWRTPETSINRATFYVMNYMRQHGVPWLDDLSGQGLSDFEVLFERVQPAAFRDIMFSHPLTVGHTELRKGVTLARSPLGAAGEEIIRPIWDNYIHATAELNRKTRDGWRYFVLGERVCLDLSSPEAIFAISNGGKVTFECSAPVHAAKIQIRSLLEQEPYTQLSEIPFKRNGKLLSFEISGRIPALALRSTLEIYVWAEGVGRVQRFHIL